MLLNGTLVISLTYILVTFGNLYLFLFSFLSHSNSTEMPTGFCLELTNFPAFCIQAFVCVLLPSLFFLRGRPVPHPSKAEALSEPLTPSGLCPPAVPSLLNTVSLLLSSTVSPCVGLLSVPTTWWLAASRMGSPRQGASHLGAILYDPGLESAECCICHILFG